MITITEYPSTDPVLVTCGLPYASGELHVGHLRTYIPADVFVRSLKKLGQDVVFISGSDTHGTPIAVIAEQEGVSPKDVVERYHRHYLEVFPKLGVNFDNFGSTDHPLNHHRTQQMVKVWIDKGYVYPKKIKLPYCPKCKRILPDRYVRGTCPYCGADARGDECDQGCGKHLEPGEILNPRCAVCGTPAEYVERTHYYFKLTAFTDFLEEFLNNVEGTKNAIAYALEWVKSGLIDWCITRDLKWGVKFPGDDSLVLYVWVDAPIGYMSMTEEWAQKIGKPDEWKKFWLPGNGKIIHFIGQDIVHHHCVYWPAMLKGADYNLPHAIIASGMVKIEGHTFSKTRGYVVWIRDFFENDLDTDFLRYYVVSYTNHTKDMDYSWKTFRDKVNNELVGTLGNFIHRAIHFTYSKVGKIPEGTVEKNVKEEVEKTISTIKNAINNYDFKVIADEVLRLAAFGNAYFQNHKPWELSKQGKTEELSQVLYNGLYIVKALAIIMEPVTPNAAEKVWKLLGYADPTEIHKITYDKALEPVDTSNTIQKPKIIFQKISDEKLKELQEQTQKRIREAEAKERKTLTVRSSKKMEEEYITFEEFQKVKIRVGHIKSAERVPDTRALLKLQVDTGDRIRTIVAGMAEKYKPEELIDKKVLVVVNLKPKKIRGIESQGMILAVEHKDNPKDFTLITIDGPPVGSKVR